MCDFSDIQIILDKISKNYVRDSCIWIYHIMIMTSNVYLKVAGCDLSPIEKNDFNRNVHKSCNVMIN